MAVALRRARHALDRGSARRVRLEGNNLLAALRPDDRAALSDVLSAWDAADGRVVHEPGDEVRHAYFPLGESLLAYQVAADDGAGARVETALVGREGAAGGIVSQGRLPAFARCVVRRGGGFLRARSVDLERAKMASPALRNLFARYADCLTAQVFQSVACNAAHGLERRAARWLCAAAERAGSPELRVTHEELAGMLGVGRSYATEVLGRLRGRGLVRTRRGAVLVADAPGLRAAACGCNDAVRRHFDEVLAGVYPGEEEFVGAAAGAGRAARAPP